MPVVPSASPATGLPTPPSFIHTLDKNFVDTHGRTLFLRGVNLSGSSKAPVGRPSYLLDDLWENAEAGGESFVGRPLNVDDGSADVHLARLRGWGFNMLRFPVTWEALEHEGPGKYDYEFMDYTVRVLRKCKEYGFRVYMDPHQDTWSRFSGGSGAPFWTLPACGINHRNITATQAAILHSEFPTPSGPNPSTLPAMIWSTNYGRLLSQTLFTLFFAGRDFAPKCVIDDVNIQDYLQQHYIDAMGKLADRIRDAGDLLEDCVIGWDSLNEPFEGLVGWDDLDVTPKGQGSTLKKGTCPTPVQGMRLGMGQAQTVDNWGFGSFGPSRDGTVTIDPKGRCVWADRAMLQETEGGVNARWGWKRDPGWKLGQCVWALHGVWDIQTGFLLRPDYFKYFTPPSSSVDPVEFLVHHWAPHVVAFAERIRAAHPEAIMFVQPPVFAPPPKSGLGEDVLKGRCAYAPHYYDGLTLVTKHWNWFNADALGLLRGKYSTTLAAVKFGARAIRASLRTQLGYLKADALALGDGEYPTLIGEIGTPMDMDDKRSYGWTDGGKYRGDYGRQEKALDASLNAADGEVGIGWTAWTYCVDACWVWGDGWNGEDLSLWSGDDIPGRDDGGEDGEDGGSEGNSLYTVGGKGIGESQAVLLRKGAKAGSLVVQTASTTASSLSLATLSPSPIYHPKVEMTPRERAGYSPTLTPFEFLTYGARAYRAFARARPVSVVGTVTDIQFDIEGGKTPLFRCVIKVSEEDGRGRGHWQGEDGDGMPTEIFLPLVHFAREKYVGKGTLLLGGDSAASSILEVDDGETIIGRGAKAGQGDAGSGHLSPVPEDAADLLDVEVKVSEGRWEVRGQMLTWWYSPTNGLQGESEKEVRIEVRRRGGVIPVAAPFGVKGRAPAQGGGMQLCERVCEDCRIM